VPKGKPWTLEDEKRLRQLVQEGKPINVIVEVLHKTEDAAYHKCKRLGLPLEEGAKGYTPSSIKLPKELPIVEETLRILAGA
jgi:hypothetical protein